MPLKLTLPVSCAVLLAAATVAAPALADVKAGVDAWSRGDYSGAVREWQGPADAGDPDAMFNLAQAYRLGRGVAVNAQRAETLYARAAAAGHLQAADTYGLMLFQDGRREAALPYVREAAKRGDPRSQYLLGIAHFNGDLVAKDWVRAYALVTLANAAGLPQAAPALAQMDEHIPLAQRQASAGLAQQLRAEADAARSVQVAAVDLAARAADLPPSPRVSQGVPVQVAPVPPRVSQAAPTIAVSPSIAAARAAVAEASRATGTESPAEAGATFARAPAPPRARPVVASAAPPAPAPVQVARREPPVARPAPSPSPAPSTPPAAAVARVPAAAPAGPWRVQLGAFSVAGNAQRLWDRLSARSELAGKQRLMVPAGAVTKLQAGGYASRDAASTACRSLQRSGQDCLVTQR